MTHNFNAMLEKISLPTLGSSQPIGYPQTYDEQMIPLPDPSVAELKVIT